MFFFLINSRVILGPNKSTDNQYATKKKVLADQWQTCDDQEKVKKTAGRSTANSDPQTW